MSAAIPQLSPQEAALMRHALGLDRPTGVAGVKTRNFFAADMPEDVAIWERLVDRGLAFESANQRTADRMFHVSANGERALMHMGTLL